MARKCAKCGRRVSRDIIVCDPCWDIKPSSKFRKHGPLNKLGWTIFFIGLPVFICRVLYLLFGGL